ncbi:sulfite exporter TauE/SafE family protein [uncultured Imperialibacter sp.]|uniref:sulfite exporter TauE/SafE family protein n=1 Tax=uncultured Imperialibacter sp. TaxID=1672639 RepID=UPI0030D8264E
MAIEPSILTIVLIILISFIVSAFGNLIGFGGGIFMVPILVTIFYYPLAIAVGSVMFSLIFSSLAATYFHRKGGHVDFKMGILLELPTMLGVVLGSFLLAYISAHRLEILFSVLVLLLGVSFWLKKEGSDQDSKSGLFYRMNQWRPSFLIENKAHHIAYRASIWMITFFGLMAGTLAGLFGIGGGFLKTPIMLKIFKMPVKIATATAMFMIIITSITGSASHYMQGHIVLSQAWPVLLGFTSGSIASHKLNIGINPEVIEKLIGLGLVLAALVMMANFVGAGAS